MFNNKNNKQKKRPFLSVDVQGDRTCFSFEGFDLRSCEAKYNGVRSSIQIDWREWKDWSDGARGVLSMLNLVLSPHGVELLNETKPDCDFLDLAAVSIKEESEEASPSSGAQVMPSPKFGQEGKPGVVAEFFYPSAPEWTEMGAAFKKEECAGGGVRSETWQKLAEDLLDGKPGRRTFSPAAGAVGEADLEAVGGDEGSSESVSGLQAFRRELMKRGGFMKPEMWNNLIDDFLDGKPGRRSFSPDAGAVGVADLEAAEGAEAAGSKDPGVSAAEWILAAENFRVKLLGRNRLGEVAYLASCENDPDGSRVPWKDLPEIDRKSAIAAACAVYDFLKEKGAHSE